MTLRLRRIVAVIEYDGAGFQGWQVQQAARTVQAVVERAFGRVANHPVRVFCAGRTDAGVHAEAQVVHFDTPADRSLRSWVFGANSGLPKDVSVLWAQQASSDFHARFSATGRTYRYLILNRAIRPALLAGRVCWEFRPLSLAAMQAGANYLVGEHDFSSYRALACQARSPVRHVRRLEVSREGDLVVIEVEANAFLHHMVRNVAGVLMAIGMGKHPPVWAQQVLEARDRTVGGVTAPPEGLYLTQVHYPRQYGLPSLPRLSMVC